jgi:hypothetical protein
MVSVIDVYNTVRDLANKEQKGFITPEVFNTLASVAQLNIYNELFKEVLNGERLRRQNIDHGRDLSYLKQVKEDLATYMIEIELDERFVDEIADEEFVAFRKPNDLGKVIALRTTDNNSIEIEYDSEKVARFLRSLLSRPTTAHPVAILGNDIRVYPESVCPVLLRYYRTPSARTFDGDLDGNSLPTYSVTEINDDFLVVNPIESRDFDLPAHYKSEVVNEILKMVGVRLRDPNLYNFSNTEDAAE